MNTLLHQALEATATRFPAREAFRCDGAALSYADVVHRANGLAHVLRDEGVRRGDRVGIYMHKGLELPVAVYGILAAGAAYVPIDPSAPLSRIQLIVQDCGIRHVVTTRSRERRAIDLAARVPDIRTVIGARAVLPSSARAIPWNAIHGAATAPTVALGGDDLAYVMYTSGSTGTPKGLMHTHASGLSYARMSARTYDVGPEDRLGNHSPLHFDMSTFEYLTGPLCGATTVIIPEETTMFPVSLAALVARERLTFWYSVPLALIQMLTRGGLEARDCRTVRWVLFGGEPFPPKHLWRLMDLWPHARFSNVYGPAEVNQCTYYHVPRADRDTDTPVPIGRVWDGAEGLIVDADGREVPRGEPGELLVRTPTMMRGYWGRPDGDVAAFFIRESPDGATGVFYRTGDMVREREDGNLVFLGRRDRQVKVRGYRVELDEVESVMTALDEVVEAAAVAVSGGDDALEIVAAVLLRPATASNADRLRRLAAERLPVYAVPQRIEILDAFPRTGTGKIDRPAIASAFRVKGPG